MSEIHKSELKSPSIEKNISPKKNITPKECHSQLKSSRNEVRSTEQRMDKKIEINFKCREGMDRQEFNRQIKAQERGLNRTNVKQFQDNRENYKKNGRSIESNEAQRHAREKAIQSRIATNQKEGMSYSKAKEEANKWISNKAALHNPDQIAGGDPNKVSRMGDAGVNKSIGSQWKSRVSLLENSVNDYAKGKSQEELKNTKLNVKLTVS